VRLGVFGGTFDPPHVGHLIVAQDACTALGLDRVLFVAAAVPPHKQDRATTPAPLRLAMLHAAIDGDERFEACDRELRRAGPSYTVETLRELRRDRPGAEIFLLLGADQVRELHLWREPAAIAALATIVELSRAGVDAAPPGIGIACRRLDVTPVGISSTEIRRRVRAGEPIRYLVPPAVESIIRRERLYTEP
jgi:nicotinate-nucleotide adenylyltransferase